MEARSLIMISFGNILEWFDFALFIYLTPVFGKYFFPAQDASFSSLLTFGILAVGFICRPIGGILFGHLGDRVGRAKTLLLSILAISLTTAAMGFLPSYSQIGIAAPFIFLILRCVHGLSVGGEYTGAVIYLGESAPSNKRGFLSSFAMMGANLGFLLATLLAILLNALPHHIGIGNWGWRLCFIGSGALGMIILYNRIKLVETASFIYVETNQKIAAKPFLVALRYAPKKLLQIFGLTAMGASFYYMFFGYMPNYLEQYYGTTILKSLGAQAIVLVILLFLLPIAGYVGDRFGRKNILICVALSIILFTIPCFYLMQQNNILLLLVGLSIPAAISAFEQSNNLITFVESCPADVRYSGISFAYNTGNAVFGGSAPFIFSLFTQKINLMASGYYLMVMALIGLTVVLTLKKQLTKQNLNFTIQEPLF